MVRQTLLILVLCITAIFSADAQAITGKWETVDDESGKVKSVVEIYERTGKVWGRVVKIFPDPGEDPDPSCTECPEDDPRFNKKIVGMEILQHLNRSGNEYDNGLILDPEIGKIYRCKLWVEGDNLKVRGYWGPFYRTQTWKRVN